MAQNCIIKKLKASLQNDNLPKFNILTLDVVPVSSFLANNSKLQLQGTQDFVVTAKNGAFFVENFSDINDQSKRLTTYNGTANALLTLYVGNVSGKLEVTQKNGITIIGGSWAENSVINVNTSEIEYNNLEELHVGSSSEIDLNALTEMPLEKLSLSGNGVKGNTILFPSIKRIYLHTCNNVNASVEDISGTTIERFMIWGSSNIGNGTASDAGEVLGEISSLVTMEITGSGLNGTVEGFVSARLSALSQQSFSFLITLHGALKQFTFGGNSYSSENTNNFIGCDSATKMYVYVGSNASNPTKILCKGFTQSEAETKWPGKTIVRVDA